MRWPKATLGECATLVNGRAYKQEELLDSGTPVLRIQNLNGGDRWYYSDLSLPQDKYCDKGDLLFAWSASFGPYLWNGPRAIYHYHIWKVLPGKSLDKGFLYHLLGFLTARVKSESHGASMLHMTKARMEALEIPLPPLEEQRRIAAILDKAYQVKELGRQRDLQINQLELGLFLESFGNPITNFLGWPTVNIGKIARVQTGNTPPRAQREYYGDEVEWIKSDNLNNSSYYATKAAVCLSAIGASMARMAPRDAILVTCIAGSPACIGNCAMVDRAVAFNQQINSLEDIDGNPHFFYAMLRLFKGIVQAASTNSMKGMVSKSRFESICIINPPRELQDLFAAKMRIVRLLQCQANELPMRADTLIQGLHKGFFMGPQVP